jgi:hypothetical protein
MAYQTIILTNDVYFKKAYRGFSWTTLFFGALPAVFRRDWKTFLWLSVANFFTFSFAGVIYSFFYNKNHFNKLLDSGYKVVKFEDEFQEAELCEWLGRVSIPTTQKV